MRQRNHCWIALRLLHGEITNILAYTFGGDTRQHCVFIHDTITRKVQQHASWLHRLYALVINQASCGIQQWNV